MSGTCVCHQGGVLIATNASASAVRCIAACKRAIVQPVDGGDFRVCTVSLALAHQEVNGSAQGRTWLRRYYKRVRVTQTVR